MFLPPECRLGGQVPEHSHPVSVMLSYTTQDLDVALHTQLDLYPPHNYTPMYMFETSVDIDDSWSVTLNLTSLSKEVATVEVHYGPDRTDVLKVKCGNESEVTITEPWNTPTSLLTSHRTLQLQVSVVLLIWL